MLAAARREFFVTISLPLCQVDNEQSSTPAYWAVVKGAPEVIQGFLAAAPADYEAAYKVYAAQGGR